MLRAGTSIVLVGLEDGLVARVPVGGPPVTDWISHLAMVDALEQDGAPFLPPCGPPTVPADDRVVAFWPFADSSVSADGPRLACLLARGPTRQERHVVGCDIGPRAVAHGRHARRSRCSVVAPCLCATTVSTGRTTFTWPQYWARTETNKRRLA